MKIQSTSIAVLALTGCHAFVPSTLSRTSIQSSSSTSNIAPKYTNRAMYTPSPFSVIAKSKPSTVLQMASAEDFDQTKYTEAAWATLAALPACADSYSSTSVEAPMLLGILLNPTKYQAGECVESCGYDRCFCNHQSLGCLCYRFLFSCYL